MFTFLQLGYKQKNLEQEIVNQLGKGNDRLFKKFYLDQKEKFISWCMSEMNLTLDEAADIYQESQMHLYENVMHGRLTKLESKLSTYLFAIGKNSIRVKYRRLSTQLKHEERLNEHVVFLKDTEELDEDMKAKSDNVFIEFKRMLDPCKSLLQLFYYDNLSFNEIANRMGYKNQNVAKNQKKRCLDKLRTNSQNQER